MFDNMRKINRLEHKLFETQLDNDVLRKEIDTLKERIENIRKEQQSCTFIFDFDIITVFSIERVFKHNVPCTVIGYLLNGDPREWNFSCNEQIHEDLCSKFEEWKGKNVGNLDNK